MAAVGESRNWSATKLVSGWERVRPLARFQCHAQVRGIGQRCPELVIRKEGSGAWSPTHHGERPKWREQAAEREKEAGV
jgi:hypothetical protein